MTPEAIAALQAEAAKVPPLQAQAERVPALVEQAAKIPSLEAVVVYLNGQVKVAQGEVARVEARLSESHVEITALRSVVTSLRQTIYELTRNEIMQRQSLEETHAYLEAKKDAEAPSLSDVLQLPDVPTIQAVQDDIIAADEVLNNIGAKPSGRLPHEVAADLKRTVDVLSAREASR